MKSCESKIPNNTKLIMEMDEQTLLAYSKFHVSLDSSDLIQALVSKLEERISDGHQRNV